MIQEQILPALEQTGYGTQQSVYFGLSNEMAPQFCPEGQIFEDVDGSEANPSETNCDFPRKYLSVTPALGYPLKPNTRYVVIVFAGPVDVDTGAIKQSKAIADFLATKQSGRTEAFRQSILNTARRQGIDVDEIAAATVYETGSPTADLDAIADQIYTAPARSVALRDEFYGAGLTGARPLEDLFGTPEIEAAGRDVSGGVRHSHIAQVLIGDITLTSWTRPLEQKSFRYIEGADGPIPTPYGTEPAEVVLVVPECPQPPAGYPVAIVQHGLGDNKEFALAMADALAAECMAVVAMDAVAHGARSRQPIDREKNFSGDRIPDGIADGFGGAGLDQFFLLKPLVARDNWMATAAGNIELEQAVERGSWSFPAGFTGTVQLDGSRIGYLGQSMGGITGALYTGTARHTQASVLNVAGGNFRMLFTDSPVFEKFLRVVDWLNEGDLMPPVDQFNPALSLLHAVLEGADPTNYARRFSAEPPADAPRKHVLVHVAYLDQLVSNNASAALAVAAGYPLLGDFLPRSWLLQEPTVTLPANTTVEFEGQSVAAGLVVYDNSDHGFIANRCATIQWNFAPPYNRIDSYRVHNGVDSAQSQVARFLQSATAGTPEITAYQHGTVGDPGHCR